jgi:hypothetical protein
VLFSRKKIKTWENIEYFDESWKARISKMTNYISPGSSVLDLGCGKMWTREFIPADCIYIPVDYVRRDDHTIVCDFNKNEFPGSKADFAFVSGCLEYVKDYEWFIKQIANSSKKCILSYCTLEKFPDIKERENLTWVNNLKRDDVVKLFENNNFKLFNEDITESNNSIFVFHKI